MIYKKVIDITKKRIQNTNFVSKRVFELQNIDSNLSIELFHINNDKYQQRFWGLFTNEELAPLFAGGYVNNEINQILKNKTAILQNNVKISLIIKVPEKMVMESITDYNSEFYKLLQAVKNSLAYINNALKFMPFNGGGLHSSISIPDLTLEKAIQAAGLIDNEIEKDRIVAVKGFSFRKDINGRCFLCMVPEKTNNSNILTDIRSALLPLGSQLTPSFLNILNLTRNLKVKERKDFLDRITPFHNKILFSFNPLDALRIAIHTDDLLINSEIYSLDELERLKKNEITIF
ncbi:MAG: hypothetical protein ABIH39_00680 [Candidatus Margulisiibacteriota bacterium]